MQSHAVLPCAFHFQRRAARQDTTKNKIHAMHQMLKTTMESGMSAYLRHPKSRANSVGSRGRPLPGPKNWNKKQECVLKDVFGVSSGKDGGMEERENKSMFFCQWAECALASLKHHGRHELLNTQYVHIICHVRLLAASETMRPLKHEWLQLQF